MKNIKQENIITTNTTKKRGRPRKNPLPENLLSQASSTTSISNYNDNQAQAYELARQIFKKIDGMHRFIEQTIQGYTSDDLKLYMSDPIRYQSYLINISNFMYTTNSFYREYIESLIKPILYNWDMKVHVKSVKFRKGNIKDKLEKNYIEFANRIKQLNLGRELKRILLKILLEDAVFGYWLEENEHSTIYYLPADWCVIRKNTEGNWCYLIDSRKVSNKNIDEVLPKEIGSLIKKYKGKSGDQALAEVPYEKSVCYKYFDHINYIMPPFVSLIDSIINILKTKEISMAKNENDVMNLIALEIPYDEDSQNNLLFTKEFIEPFVSGINDVISSLTQTGWFPTPMKPTVLPLSRSQTSEKDVVKDSINTLGSETNQPNFSEANNAATMKKAIENAQSKMFSLLDQISDSINLKLRIEGFDYPYYSFEYKILHVNEHNQEDVRNITLKAAQSGQFVKTELASLHGNPPTAYLGQSYLEDIVFKDIIDNSTVVKTSHTQSGESGRPSNESKGQILSPAGEQTEDTDANSKDNRNI